MYMYARVYYDNYYYTNYCCCVRRYLYSAFNTYMVYNIYIYMPPARVSVSIILYVRLRLRVRHHNNIIILYERQSTFISM